MTAPHSRTQRCCLILTIALSGTPLSCGRPASDTADSEAPPTALPSRCLDTPVPIPPSEAVRLYPVKRSGLWGYMDRSGALVIEPRYDWADAFHEEVAAVWQAGKFGYINEAGEMIIAPRFDMSLGFSCGVTFAWVNGKVGLIDKRGDWIMEPQYGGASRFSEGLAAVKTLNGWAYIDTTGKTQIRAQFSWGGQFSEGLAVVQCFPAPGCAITWGYIDKSGTLAMGPWTGTQGGRFSEGLAPAVKHRNSLDPYGRWGYIGRQQQVVIPFRFAAAEPFSEGLAAVAVYTGTSQGRDAPAKWGYIDHRGAIVIKPQYDEAHPFRGGLAQVGIDFKLGYIDRSGRYVWPPTEE